MSRSITLPSMCVFYTCSFQLLFTHGNIKRTNDGRGGNPTLKEATCFLVVLFVQEVNGYKWTVFWTKRSDCSRFWVTEDYLPFLIRKT